MEVLVSGYNSFSQLESIIYVLQFGLNLGYVFEPTPTIKALTNMMNFYVSFILSSCKQILTCKFEGKLNSTLLMMSPVGVLFHEFMIYMIILQNYAPIIASNCDGIPQLAELLDLYDAFNKSFKYDNHIHEKDGHDEHQEKG